MHYRKWLIPLFISPCIWANTTPTDMSVTVFTTKAYAIQNKELAHHIYFLDAVENLEEQAMSWSSTDMNSTAEQAKQWLHSEAAQSFHRNVKEAYIGVTEGWKMGVMKVPAVVFQANSGETAVIYGQTDVEKAIADYRKYQE